MRKYLFILIALFAGSLAEASNNDSNILKKFIKTAHHSVPYPGTDVYPDSFVGDTIIFNFPGKYEYLEGFFAEQPDTIWLKKRPKKNPKEGKHYLLNYVYKSEPVGENKYLTPASAINGKPFGVFSVKKLDKDNPGYVFTLIDPENIDIITFVIPANYPLYGSFTTVKTQRLINSLLNKELYHTYSSISYNPLHNVAPDFCKLKMTKGVYNVSFGPTTCYTTYPYNFKVECELTLESDNELKIEINPIKDFYNSQKPILLTAEDYKKEYADYTVNSTVNQEMLNNKEPFPFSFEIILGTTKSYYQGIYKKIDRTNPYQTPDSYLEKEVIFIGDVQKAEKDDFYKACFNGKAFFIKKSDVELNSKHKARLDTLLQQPQSIRDRFFNSQLDASQTLYLNDLTEAIEKIESYSKYGLAIPEWGVFDVSEYTEGTGIEFKFLNPTKVPIKYVTVSFQGYNRVDDPVGSVMTRKCIGPIMPDESAYYRFDYTWYTDVVQYAKIRSIVVQYKNGTSRTISNPSKIIFPRELRDFLWKKDPVSTFF